MTNSALVYEPKCGVSSNDYLCAHGTQINFGDLTSYSTYGIDKLYKNPEMRHLKETLGIRGR